MSGDAKVDAFPQLFVLAAKLTRQRANGQLDIMCASSYRIARDGESAVVGRWVQQIMEDNPGWSLLGKINVMEVLREELDLLCPQAVAPGLPPEQEPKYTTDGRAIINRASGEAIPADEPVFVLRARDLHALFALKAYAREIGGGDKAHLEAVRRRIEDFTRFAQDNAGRMKQPDTEQRRG